MNTNIIYNYFPSLTPHQKEAFEKLKPLYEYWNRYINVISRKDTDLFYTHHVLHSLSLHRVINFAPTTKILDVGTGGGFPGIPLSILFPEVQFTLLDSIEKKIKVVTAVVNELGLQNVVVVRDRVENHKEKYDFVVSRAVSNFQTLKRLTSNNIDQSRNINQLHNGLLLLKGGDLDEELRGFEKNCSVFNIHDFFNEDFFLTKKIIYHSI